MVTNKTISGHVVYTSYENAVDMIPMSGWYLMRYDVDGVSGWTPVSRRDSKAGGLGVFTDPEGLTHGQLVDPFPGA